LDAVHGRDGTGEHGGIADRRLGRQHRPQIDGQLGVTLDRGKVARVLVVHQQPDGVGREDQALLDRAVEDPAGFLHHARQR
jgi:hypothetical protein